MQIDGWKYYNHAAIPTSAPHEEVNIEPINNGEIWKIDKGVLMARWHTNWDCGHETNWWYCIKDEPFDISSIKSKKRYEINKGKKNFDIRVINPKEYAEEMFEVRKAAFSAYPKKYRKKEKKESGVMRLASLQGIVYGAFDIESKKLCGFITCSYIGDKCLNFERLQVIPEFQGKAINAALVNYMLEQNELFLSNGGYISDGERNIRHETAFQEYLVKYFEFRMAYCNLNISYSKKIKPIISFLYPIRKVLNKLDSIGIIHNINGILMMEELRRESI